MNRESNGEEQHPEAAETATWDQLHLCEDPYFHLSDADTERFRRHVGWKFVGKYLRMRPEQVQWQYRAGLLATKAKLKRALANQGRNGGEVNPYKAFRDVVGADALAHCFIGDSEYLMFLRIYGVPAPNNEDGEQTLLESERDSPYRLFSLSARNGGNYPIVIAPDINDPSEYSAWAVCKLAARAFGANQKSLFNELIREFRGHGLVRTQRVRLDGRVRPVPCIPLTYFLPVVMACRVSALPPRRRSSR